MLYLNDVYSSGLCVEQVGANFPLTSANVSQGNSADVGGVLLVQNHSDWETPSRDHFALLARLWSIVFVSTGWKIEGKILQRYSFNPFK